MAVLIAAIAGCGTSEPKGPAELPAITAPLSDEFERTELGPEWHATSEVYKLVNGAVSAQGAFNRPLWLRRALPRDAVIELDVWSTSPEGDIKVELYGDGRSFDKDKGSYLSTGYVAVMGGWQNTKSQLARLDEHGADLVSRKGPKVEAGRRYHWKFVRRGATLEWYVQQIGADGRPEGELALFLSYEDPRPLEGPEHQFFAINNWQTDTWFDNLRIAPLDGAAPAARVP